MKKRKRKFICVVGALLTCLMLFILQWGVYRYLDTFGIRILSPVAEENTLIRLQQASKLKGECLFMGSSLTERLLPQDELACLASPGSDFTASLEILTNPHQFSPGTVYVLEINNMFSGRDKQLNQKTKEWGFNYFKDSAHFSVAAKPTSLIVSIVYAILDSNRRGGYTAYDDIHATPVDTSTVATLTDDEIRQWEILIRGVEVIKSRGGKVCFVYLPVKVMSNHYSESYQKGLRFAKYMDIPLLDYQNTSVFKYLEYTDSSHLRSTHIGTKRLMRTIARDAKLYAVVPRDDNS